MVQITYDRLRCGMASQIASRRSLIVKTTIYSTAHQLVAAVRRRPEACERD